MNFNNRYNQLLGENDSSIVSGTYTIPSGSFIMYNDTREHHWGGKFKRVDGPKVFDVDFYYLRWYNNKGDLHRIDGPAIISYKDRHMEWWVDGKRHRLDGPAYVERDGYKAWFINDEELSEAQFNKIAKVMNAKSRTDVSDVLSDYL